MDPILKKTAAKKEVHVQLFRPLPLPFPLACCSSFREEKHSWATTGRDPSLWGTITVDFRVTCIDSSAWDDVQYCCSGPRWYLCPNKYMTSWCIHKSRETPWYLDVLEAKPKTTSQVGLVIPRKLLNFVAIIFQMLFLHASISGLHLRLQMVEDLNLWSAAVVQSTSFLQTTFSHPSANLYRKSPQMGAITIP